MERLQNGGEEAVDALSRDELEAIVDDLALGLESEDIRLNLPRIMRRVDDEHAWRAFRRIIEIARQDLERTPLLLSALKEVRWRGTPSEDEFGWLLDAITGASPSTARLDAYERTMTLELKPDQMDRLDALARAHPDDEVWKAHLERRGLGSEAPVDYTEEKPAERMTVRTLLRSLEGGAENLGPPPEPAETAAPAPEPAGEGEAVNPMTVRTLLRSLDTVKVKLDEAPPEPVVALATTPSEVFSPDPAPPASVTVSTLLRSLDTVRVSLEELGQRGLAPGEPAAAEPAASPSPTPLAPPKPARWSDLDLPSLSLQDRSRKLARVRRELKPEDRRAWLDYLLRNESDPVIGPSVRKELLEFAFERPVFTSFDHATKAKLGRWIRDRSISEAVPTAAVLAALRRATWVDGEPPRFDDDVRPVVEAATGALARTPSEERINLLGRDFSIWLFAVREFEDHECLEAWARDKTPGVAEGLFRALAAMDALAARVGGTGGGPTALELTLGMWDNADVDSRIDMAHAIAAGWSRGLVNDRAAFFKAFWKRHLDNENQREAAQIALASFDKELEEARRGTTPGSVPPSRPAPAPPPPAPPRPEPAPIDLFRADPLPPKPVGSPFAVEGTQEDETTSRYFARQREQIERAMKFSIDKEKTPAPRQAARPPPVAASAPVQDPTDPRSVAAPEDMALPDEGEVFDEDPTGPGPGAPRSPDPTPPPSRPLPPIGKPLEREERARETTPTAPDQDVVLPGEPLRTLAEYTGFLRALSAGSAIDELLEKHGMDYRQYASCMTAWGRLLQSRPDLALRMGQLLRG